MPTVRGRDQVAPPSGDRTMLPMSKRGRHRRPPAPDRRRASNDRPETGDRAAPQQRPACRSGALQLQGRLMNVADHPLEHRLPLLWRQRRGLLVKPPVAAGHEVIAGTGDQDLALPGRPRRARRADAQHLDHVEIQHIIECFQVGEVRRATWSPQLVSWSRCLLYCMLSP